VAGDVVWMQQATVWVRMASRSRVSRPMTVMSIGPSRAVGSPHRTVPEEWLSSAPAPPARVAAMAPAVLGLERSLEIDAAVNAAKPAAAELVRDRVSAQARVRQLRRADDAVLTSGQG
jgi:hypothetical protein